MINSFIRHVPVVILAILLTFIIGVWKRNGLCCGWVYMLDCSSKVWRYQSGNQKP